MSNFDAGALETTVSESSNPMDGRPAGSRSYGEASTAMHTAAPQTRSAAPTAAPPFPAGPSPVTAGVGAGVSAGSAAGAGTGQYQAPAPDPSDSRRLGLPGSAEGVRGALSGAGRSFARVSAAIGSATQESRQSRPGSGAAGASPQARVRKARLRVARVDPWSVMKVSFVLSIAMGIVTIVGTAVVWNVLNALGVFSSLNKTVGDLTSSGTTTGTSSFSLSSFLSFGHVEGYMMIIALVDVVLATALATLGAYLYNLAAGFVGGFEVTLAEDQ